MHIVMQILCIVIFMILTSETALIVKHISNSKEIENEQNKFLENNTLRNDDDDDVKWQAMEITQYSSTDITLIYVLVVIFAILFAFITVLVTILYRCPNYDGWDVDNVPVLNYNVVYTPHTRPPSDQPRIRRSDYYEAVYIRSNEPIKDDENTEEI